MPALKYHIALSHSLNLEEIDRAARTGERPRHTVWALSQRLGAAIHRSGTEPILPLDRLRAQLIGRPAHWSLARTLSSQLKSDDLIFCTGEDVGIPIATLCGAKRERPKIVVFIHSLIRPRGVTALKLFPVADRIDLFLTNTPPQADFLRRYLQLPESRVRIIAEQTDTQFFTPGPASPSKVRPLIASVGLERRDYRTLAKATWNLDVDVKISGFSQAVSASSRTFPKTLPDNMSRRFYEWPELVQLYRDADVVVVSLLKSKETSGITTLLEAMSCRRPVVVTKTQGLSSYLSTPGTVITVDPGDVTGMRQAIVSLLNNPQEAEAQAQRSYKLVLKDYNSEQYVESIAKLLTSLAPKEDLLRNPIGQI